MEQDQRSDEVLKEQKTTGDILTATNKEAKITGEDQLFFGVIISLLLLFVTLSANDTAVFLQNVFNVSKDSALNNANAIKYLGILVFLVSSITRYCAAVVNNVDYSKKLRYISFEGLWFGLSMTIFIIAINLFTVLTPSIGLLGLSVTMLILTFTFIAMLLLERFALSFYVKQGSMPERWVFPFTSSILLVAIASSCIALTVEVLVMFLQQAVFSPDRFLITYLIAGLLFFLVVGYVNRREAKLSTKWLRQTISEKVYLLIVALVFLSLSIVLGLEIWVLPEKFIEYGFATNLFTSSIFSVLTILLLSFFLNIREQREWRSVKNEAKTMICTELASVFSEILDLTKNGLTIRLALLRETDAIKSKELIINNIMSIAEGKFEIDTERYKKLPDKRKLQDIQQHFSNIELKYSKHLPAKVVYSIVRLQTDIEFLTHHAEISKEADSFKQQAKDAKNKLVEVTIEVFEEQYLNMQPIKDIVKEMAIHLAKMHTYGYDFAKILNFSDNPYAPSNEQKYQNSQTNALLSNLLRQQTPA